MNVSTETLVGILGASAGLLACGGVPLKSQADLAKEQAACLQPIEIRYTLAVIGACPDRETRKDCPLLPAIQAERRQAEIAAGCRE